MKRIILSVIFLVLVILASLYLYKGLLVSSYDNIDLSEYEKLYYYNRLTEEQKEVFIKLDKGIDNLEPKIKLGLVEFENIKANVDAALKAIYNDRPEYYFLPNEYNVKTIKIFKNAYVFVEFEYDIKNKEERNKNDRELKNAIQQLLYRVLSDDMTQIEKEIAIHDELASMVQYYKYDTLADIPHKKHTSYAALVEKEAVCDGISKAMQMLLNEVEIQSIIVFGKVDNIPHAWNIVNIEGENYHLDATSNVIEIDSKKYVVHNNFNLSDKQIETTHIISDEFDVPKCLSDKYNYYIYNDYEVKYMESMRSKLAKVINKQLNSGILEVKIDPLYSTQDVLEGLYFLDYNNWHTNGKTSMKYHKINDIYIFKNESNKRIIY